MLLRLPITAEVELTVFYRRGRDLKMRMRYDSVMMMKSQWFFTFFDEIWIL